MAHKGNPTYAPIFSNDSDSDASNEGIEAVSYIQTSSRKLRWIAFSLGFLVIVTNVGWAWAYHHNQISQQGLLKVAMEKTKESYPPTRTILQPIYQDTEFNEEGKNKERADNLWKGLFPNGNGVISLNKSEVETHGLHETAVDPSNVDNRLYIIAGFHTMHCVTILRSSLWHYHQGEPQTNPWTHAVHCLDMIRQTLMCNLDTTIMWLHDADTFADGQLHVCKDFWGLHQWMTEHAG